MGSHDKIEPKKGTCSKVNRGKNFACSECPYMSSQAGNLERHLKKHMKDFACSECPYLTTNPSRFKYHIKKQHGGIRRAMEYNCSFCSHSEFEKAFHDNHVKSKHDKICMMPSMSWHDY